MRIATTFLAVFLVSCASAPQHPATPVTPQAAARAMMQRVRYCALVTLGDDGQPQARTIDPSEPDDAFHVTFVTNGATRKVSQLARDPRVTLYYFDEHSPGYVTLIGSAKRIEDPSERQRRWISKWSPFYPGGARDAVVYEITPSRIEVVDVAHGVTGDPQTWTPPSFTISH